MHERVYANRAMIEFVMVVGNQRDQTSFSCACERHDYALFDIMTNLMVAHAVKLALLVVCVCGGHAHGMPPAVAAVLSQPELVQHIGAFLCGALLDWLGDNLLSVCAWCDTPIMIAPQRRVKKNKFGKYTKIKWVRGFGFSRLIQIGEPDEDSIIKRIPIHCDGLICARCVTTTLEKDRNDYSCPVSVFGLKLPVITNTVLRRPLLDERTEKLKIVSKNIYTSADFNTWVASHREEGCVPTSYSIEGGKMQFNLFPKNPYNFLTDPKIRQYWFKSRNPPSAWTTKKNKTQRNLKVVCFGLFYGFLFERGIGTHVATGRTNDDETTTTTTTCKRRKLNLKRETRPFLIPHSPPST